MGITSDTTPSHDPSAPRKSQGTEAEQKGGKKPAQEHAKRDYEDSPKEDGE